MDLAEHLDTPILIELAGQEYGFSELFLEDWAHLDAWLKRTHPHPLEVIKPYLDGLTPEERKPLIDGAMERGRDWPPKLLTGEGLALLFSDLAGQIEALFVALRLHQPQVTRRDAQRLHRDVLRAGQVDRMNKALAIAFGTDTDAARGEDGRSKKGKPRATPPTGTLL
jgi:hypothetical protein